MKANPEARAPRTANPSPPHRWDRVTPARTRAPTANRANRSSYDCRSAAGIRNKPDRSRGLIDRIVGILSDRRERLGLRVQVTHSNQERLQPGGLRVIAPCDRP